MKRLKRFFLCILVLLALYLYFLSGQFKNINQYIEESNQKLLFPQTICGRYPEKENINFDNQIWQILKLSNGVVKILNAYLDTRQNQSIVRFNVNSFDIKIRRDKIFCQFWFERSSQPIVTIATEYILMWLECKV